MQSRLSRSHALRCHVPQGEGRPQLRAADGLVAYSCRGPGTRSR
ncbi:hypothetical protein GL4_1386 [Methyloceanibacter caenitepidi]|uniref:Uncharacterized protein n=1 Tax=Methyloceanibacter caenitepidi TaxID=1384459 RepID=A0A0A8K4C7_9HYPH|nr:hypothetical protein GL4_1386 [Methyloceanibacter caenitepidi]